MKSRFFTILMLLVLLVSIGGSAQAASVPPADRRALVYVELGVADDLSRFASTQLPMYSMLEGGLLTGADQRGLVSIKQAGLNYQLLDPALGSGSYYWAETRSSRPAPDFSDLWAGAALHQEWRLTAHGSFRGGCPYAGRC